MSLINTPPADTEGIGMAASTTSVPSVGEHGAKQEGNATLPALLATAAAQTDAPSLPLHPHTSQDAPPHEHRPSPHTSFSSPSASLTAQPSTSISGDQAGEQDDVAVPIAAAAAAASVHQLSAAPVLHSEDATEMTAAPRRDSTGPLQLPASTAAVPPPPQDDQDHHSESGEHSGRHKDSMCAPVTADRDAPEPPTTRERYGDAEEEEEEEEESLSSIFSRATIAPAGTLLRRSVGFILPRAESSGAALSQDSTDFSDPDPSVLDAAHVTALSPQPRAEQMPLSTTAAAAEGSRPCKIGSSKDSAPALASPDARDAGALATPSESRIGALRQHKKFFQGLAIKRPADSRSGSVDYGVQMTAPAAASAATAPADNEEVHVLKLHVGQMDSSWHRRSSSNRGCDAGMVPLAPLHERAKHALLTPVRNAYTPQPRSAHSRGNSDGAAVTAAGSGGACASPAPPLAARDRVGSWVTPLLRTPRLRAQPTSDINSPLVVDRSVLEEPQRSPATFDTRLREGKQADGAVTTHMVWQSRDSGGHAFLSPSFLLIPEHDCVCIHWYDSSEEVFETDPTYLHVMPGGQHSCYNTNVVEDAEMPVLVLGGDATPERLASRGTSYLAASITTSPPATREVAVQQAAANTNEKSHEEHVLVNDAADMQLRLSMHSAPLHRRILTGGSVCMESVHLRGLSDSSAVVTPWMRGSVYRPLRLASEVVLPTTAEDGVDSGAAHGAGDTVEDSRAHDRASIAAAGFSNAASVSIGMPTPDRLGQSGLVPRQTSSFCMLQRAETRVELGANCHTFTTQFSKPGDYYFVLSRHKRTMRLHVQVYTDRAFIAWRLILAIVAVLFAVALIVVVVLVLAYWMHHSTYIMGEDSAASYTQYLAFLDIHEIITLQLFPWLAVGVLIILLVLLAAIGWSVYRCFFPARAGAFTRGIHTRHRRIAGLCTVGLTFGFVVLMFAAFGLELNVADGLDNFAQAVAGAVVSSLNLFSTAALQVKWFVEEMQKVMPNVTLPTAEIASLTEKVSSLLETIQKWTRFIEDVAQGVFRALPIVLFLAMQLGFFAAALTIGALALRFRHAVVATSWMLAVSAGLFACVCGVHFAITTVFSKVYASAVVLRDDTANFGTRIGLANDSFVSQLFSMCTITFSDVQIVSDLVDNLLLEVNSTLDASGQAEFAEIFDIIHSMVPTTIETLANYTTYLKLNLDALQTILDKDGAAVNNLLKQNVVPMLRVLVSIVDTLTGLINCQVLRDVVAGAIPIFQQSVQRYNSAVFVLLLVIFGISVLLFVSSIASAYAVRHPRRSWCCLRTGRWFRFRYSYKVHLATLMQGSKDVKHEQTTLQWLMQYTTPFMYQLHSAKLICYSSSTLMFFNSILMVLFNEVSRNTRDSKLMRAMSYIGCAQLFFLLFASLFRRAWIRWILHAAALLCSVACLALAVAQAIIGYVYFGQCVGNKRYDTSGLQNGSPVGTMTCSARYMGFNIEAAIYATVWFLNAVTLVVKMTVLVRHESRLRAAFAFRPYAGVLRRCERFAPWLRHVFADQMYVKRIYTGLIIVVILAALSCFAVLDIGEFSVIRGSSKSTLTDSDIVQVIDPTKACNGDAAYCSLRTNQIIWACAHNAHSSLEDGFVTPNHYYSISRQLSAGIRSFMIDVWYDVIDANVSDAVDVYVCHAICVAGRRPYRAIAQEFKDFLDAYPDQVIMIIFEQYVNSSDLGRITDEVGLTKYVWYNTQLAPNYNPDYVWPTLQEMVDTNQRAMMFNDVTAIAAQSANCPEWLYYSFDFQYENSYTTVNTSVWKCDIRRGWCTDLSTVQLPDDTSNGCETRCDSGSGNSSSSGGSSSNGTGSGSSNGSSGNGTDSGSSNSSVSSSSSSSSSSCIMWCPSSDSGSNSSSTSSSSSSLDNTSLILKDVTNCTLFGADPSYSGGSDGYNKAFGTNPPNVRSKLSTMNHFITVGMGSPVSASQANQRTSIQSRTWNCSSRWNAVVNILAFDFWSIATPLATIEAMNQNIAKHGRQYNFENAWMEMLFGTNTLPV